MKKIKYFLMLSLIVIFVAGVFVGCSNAAELDSEKYPNKITYCANGGDLAEKTERYLYVQDNVRAIEPVLDSSAIIVAPTYAGYKFLGWAEGKVNSDGTPVLRDTPVTATDGGVWVNADGAITAEAAASDHTAQHKYYDYDVDDFWDFSKDIVTDDTVLVAVWGEYNKFIMANATNGEWEDLGDLLAGNVTETDSRYEGYQARMYDVTDTNGTRILAKNVKDAFEEQHAGYTAIRYYLDEEMTQEIVFPYVVTDTITVIYCLEIEGEYEIVTGFNDFRKAIGENKNIYVDSNIDMADKDISTINSVEYRGIIKGNGYAINGVVANVKQTVCKEGEQNIYGGLFGVLDGAQIYDLTVNIKVVFEIGINPNPAEETEANAGSALDATCYVGTFAAKMTDCTLQNVTVVAEYEIARKLVGNGKYDFIEGNMVEQMEENTYNVTVTVSTGWQAVESSDNAVMDSTITVSEKEEPGDVPEGE